MHISNDPGASPVNPQPPLNPQTTIDLYCPVDAAIHKLAETLGIFRHFKAPGDKTVMPDGRALTAVRDDFISGKIEDFAFPALKLEFDPKDAKAQLDRIVLDLPPRESVGYDQVISEALANRVRGLKYELELLTLASQRIPAPDDVTHQSRCILYANLNYPAPSEAEVQFAESVLRKVSPPVAEEKPFTSADAKRCFEENLRQAGIMPAAGEDPQPHHWRIVERESPKTFSIDESQRTIYLPQGRTFSAQEIGYLFDHEVGVHVFCSANGYRQPVLTSLFALGFPGYRETQEGLGIYVGENWGTIADKSYRTIATSTIIVDSWMKGQSFREAYQRVLELQPDPSDPETKKSTFTSVARTFGAGYGRDHVYLRGYLEVKEFLKNGGELRDLWVGKVGIGDLGLVCYLREKQLLLPPEHLPWFLQDGGQRVDPALVN